MPGIPTPSNFTNRYPKKSAVSISNYNEDPRRESILQARDMAQQVDPAYQKLMAAPDDRRAAIEQMQQIQKMPEPPPFEDESSGPSAYEQYQSMIAQFDPHKMASDQYGPQYAMLDRLNADAKKRYGENNKSMGDMYAALRSSIRGDATGIKQNYDSAGDTLDENYADTQKEVRGYQDNSRNKTAELMKNLGIQAAAPVGLGNMNESGDRWNKLMAASNLSNTNANTQNRTSSLDYNNTMQERAGFEGAAQQSGLMNGFNDFVNGNEVKRLGIQGEQSGTESGYKMKLMDMYGQMASQEGNNEASAMKAANAQANSDRNFQAKQDAAQQSQDRYSESQMTPYDKLIQSSRGMGFDDGTAQTAANLIKSQYVGNDSGKFLDSQQSQSLNGNEFIRQLMTENPAMLSRPGFSQASFENLARQYFDNMYKK